MQNTIIINKSGTINEMVLRVLQTGGGEACTNQCGWMHETERCGWVRKAKRSSGSAERSGLAGRSRGLAERKRQQSFVEWQSFWVRKAKWSSGLAEQSGLAGRSGGLAGWERQRSFVERQRFWVFPLQVLATSFDTMVEDKAMDMKWLVLNYVKSLQGMLQEAAGIPGMAPTASKTKIVLENGFPKLPQPFDVKKYNKKKLENLYRDYIGSHYCTWVHLDASHIFDIHLGVATERRTQQAPWSCMKPDTLKYVNADKLPRPDFVLDDPWAMKMELLCEFFEHIAKREKTFQLGEIFHFKYADSRRKRCRGGSKIKKVGF